MAKFEAFTYDVVTDVNLQDLITVVNHKLGKGYKPVGGISCVVVDDDGFRWAQAMAKPVKPVCEPETEVEEEPSSYPETEADSKQEQQNGSW